MSLSFSALRAFGRLFVMRLWMRLALGFGALVALMLVVVVLAAVEFRQLGQHSEQLTNVHLQRLMQVQNIRQYANGHGNAMARLLTAPRRDREVIYPVVDAENAQVEQQISALSYLLEEPVSVQLVAKIAQHQRRYRQIFAGVAERIESGDGAQARTMFNDEAQPALRALLDVTAQLLALEQQVLAQHQADTQQSVRRAQWSLVLLAAGAMVLAAFLAWSTTASVVRPLENVEQAARRIAGGDYAARVAITNHDELGNVAQAINAIATAVAAREAQIEHLAYYDGQTDLANRTGLRQLARKLAPRPMGMMLMDVARLRTVNEVLGFEVGDGLLIQVAARLHEAIADRARPGSMTVLARLSGGVFAALCVDMDRAEMERLMERIDHHVTQPLVCDGHAVDAQLVYGMADGLGAEAPAFGVLLQQAELALSTAKLGKLAWAWHVPLDPQARAGQLSLLSSLRSAAVSGELEMWLQPKQCLLTGDILGMEALVRWRHPERGYVSPAEFIPFAERTGHIGVVTRAMLDAAFRVLADWQGSHPQLSISVNVSAHDVQDNTFADRVAQLARLHKAPMQGLRLEITESSLMEDADRVMPVLMALRASGVALSIDDFGTGYSSLAYLRKLPVSELKIDRSFVARADEDSDAQALLRTIIDLGHSMNMLVTAEGIERVEELDLLKAMGCDQAQGYLIARPMPLAQVSAYLAARVG